MFGWTMPARTQDNHRTDKEKVAELVNQYLAAGTYIYNFDASKLPSGIYIYALQSGNQFLSKKMTLIK